MIEAIKRAFRPIGKARTREADALLTELRTAAEAAEAERLLLQQQREQQHWLERAVIPVRKQEREPR